jgi:Tol biopolymer transport system component
MFKRTDRGVEAVVRAYKAGNLEVPSMLRVALADGAVGYTDSGGHLSAGTIASLRTFSERIVDGAVVVNPVPATEPPTVPFTASFVDVETGARSPVPAPIDGGLDYARSPDGARFAFIPCCSGGASLAIAEVDGDDVRVIRSQARKGYFGPVWSPDGTSLLYQKRTVNSEDMGALVVRDMASGQEREILNFEGSAYWWWMPPRWSRDGQRVLFHMARDAFEHTTWDVWSVPAAGGDPTMLVTEATFPTELPSGEIAFVIPSDGLPGNSISIADPATGARRTLVRARHGGIWMPSLSPDGTRLAYQDGGAIYVADVTSGDSDVVASGSYATWRDDRTLVVVQEPAE